MIILLITLLTILILNPNISKEVINESLIIFTNSILPILFPSFIIIEMLRNEYLIQYFYLISFKYLKKIINIRYPTSSLIILIAIIGGAPLSTKLIIDSLNNNLIDKNEANSLIYSFSFLSLPYQIFIYNMANIPLFLILFSYLISLIIFRLINTNLQSTITELVIKKNKRINTFTKAIKSAINSLLSILAVIICFKLLLKILNCNIYLLAFFEPLSGQIELLKIKTDNLRNILIILSTEFLGLSVHIQMLYFYNEFSYIKFIILKTFKALLIPIYLVLC